ncbi:MAG: hypothetical protein M1502_02485 [Deltaproteobacteria bacterium]|nr:hypothetical protein [Deltaproteobacteria bacterium]
MTLWNNETEIYFFKEALKSFTSPEQLFYNLKDGYYAYIQMQKGRPCRAEILL